MNIATGSQALVELESQMVVTSEMWALRQEHTSSDKSTDKLLTIEPSLLPQ